MDNQTFTSQMINTSLNHFIILLGKGGKKPELMSPDILSQHPDSKVTTIAAVPLLQWNLSITTT